ncbi:MAG TPA: hypothetical protein VFQ67_15985 [Allosphingosinicella sp.]|nr:hypothetical protein [Allosphingosinicella sp.]
MVNTLVYLGLLFGCGLYVALRGGPPERVGATILTVGSLLTYAAVSSTTSLYRSLEIGVFLVDVATLLAFLLLALRADRLWPLCITALQVVGTAGHAVKLADPQILPYAYAFALRFWGYPMIFLLMIGTWSHQRRLARFGVDKSWSSFSGLWGQQPPAGPIS